MEQVKKVVLYGAMGIICLLLWQAWMKDQAQHKTAKSTQTTPAQYKTATTTHEQQQSKQQTAKQQSAPPSQSAAPAQSHETTISPQISQADQWIHVKTDKLDVNIDPEGGYIVQGKLRQYYQTMDKKKPVSLLSPQQSNYFIASDGLVNSQTQKPLKLQFNSEHQTYSLQPNTNQLKVTLKAQTDQALTVYKTFTFHRNQYNVDVDYRIVNQGNQTWEGYLFNQLTKRKTEDHSSYFRMNTFTGASYSTKDAPYSKLDYDTIATKGLDQQTQGGWVAFQQRYFISAWVPTQDQHHQYFAFKQQNGLYSIGYNGPQIKLAPNDQHQTQSKIYMGPEIASNLKPLAQGLDLTVDYGWLWFISAAIFWVMKYIHQVVGNWGWSIILVTVLIKLVFFKLSESSYRSMAKMRKLQPKLEALKEKYGDDRQKLGQATMELYKQEKVNPLGGCLPILVQIPVFIGLYYVLIESVQLRHAPFMLWIQDLSARDPYYILPILMGLSMFLQQRLSPQPADPRQAKMMMFLPIIFTIFFMTFPAGLVLYWLVNNCLSILQQWYIMRRMG